MKRLFFGSIVLISGILLPIPLSILAQNIPPHPSQLPLQNRSDALDFEQLATQITVKVIAGKTWGSGIIINREGEIYTVLTNRHVVNPADEHQIQAPDGQVYSAFKITERAFYGNDLAVLEFRVENTMYQVAQLSNSPTLKIGDFVFASGFPIVTNNLAIDVRGLTVTTGEIARILDRPLQQGYQLGYTNDIRKGMSGGPVFNGNGEVIGVNGMHAYPIWGDPYIYQDGSQPTVEDKQEMRHYSWAILMETFTRNSPNSINEGERQRPVLERTAEDLNPVLKTPSESGEQSPVESNQTQYLLW